MPWHMVEAGQGKYFVVDDKGKRYEEKPIPKWRAAAQIRALNANKPKTKELSLDIMARKIRDAISQKISPNNQPKQESPWIRDIYDTFIIYEVDSKCFKMDYIYDPSNETVILGQPQEVKQAWVPITKDHKLLGRFENKVKLTKDGLPASAFLIVEDPEKVTTWHLPVHDSAGKPDHRLMGAAWAALHGGYRGQKYEGPGKMEAIGKLRKMYMSEEMPMPGGKSFSVFKDSQGNYRWLTISSNSFRDRDGEIITEKALAEDVDRCDKSGEYGPLRWWHIGAFETPDGVERWDTWKAGKGVDLGMCDFNMLHGRMLIESGTFKDAVTGEAFAEAQGNLEISLGFAHPPGEPINKEFLNIHRFERSLLPEGMASNLLTKLSVLKGEKGMKTQEKLKALRAILQNKPELAKQILDDAENIQKAAEEAGLEFKEVEEMISAPASVEETPEAEAPAETPVPEPVAETPAQEPDMIGDMSHANLTAFVTEVITQVMSKKDLEAELKQATRDQVMADTLMSLKSLGERFSAIEKSVEQNKKDLLTLTDARPVGIKQLMDRRPTAQKDNVVDEAPAGPHMDPGFMKLAQGGK